MTNEISSFYKTNQFVYIRLYMYKYKNNYFRDHTFDLLRKKPANKSLIEKVSGPQPPSRCALPVPQ